MSEITYTFKYTHMEADSTLEALAREKMHGVEKLLQGGAEIKVEFARVSTHGNATERVEIMVVEGGYVHRAEHSESTYIAALNLVKDDLEREIVRSHRKRESIVRRGSRRLKAMLRWGSS